MSESLTFTNIEANICTVSRLIEEDKLYFVQMSGPPLMAILLAKHTHAQKVGYVVEEGAIAPNPHFPLPGMMVGASRAHYRSAMWANMNMVDFHTALGYMDYGILSAVQIDSFGNFNSTIIGDDYDKPQRRFGGPGGANEIASMSWRTIIMTKLEKRKFVEKLDFMSSPGYLDGTPDARRLAGMPPDTGPYRVVTERALFDFDGATRRMRLIAVAPWTTVAEVLDLMDFQPLLADEMGVLAPPTDDELTIIRSELDPTGMSLARGQWITVER